MPIVILSLASSLAIAKDDNVDCGKLDNDRARQECREHEYNNGDCGRPPAGLPAPAGARYGSL
jgi:hypothetical protein